MLHVPVSKFSDSLDIGNDSKLRIIFNDNYVDIYFRINKTPSSPTLVLFNGAVDRTRMENSTVFQRSSWTSEIEAHCIFISDPTLNLSKDLAIGWGLGNSAAHGMDLMRRSLDRVLSNLISRNLISESSRLNFFGSSAGGFQAIYVSSFYPTSKVTAINPQIDLTNYFDKEVRKALWTSFGSESVQYAYNNYQNRLNALALIGQNKVSPEINIFINTASKDDINRELPTLIDFIKNHSELANYFNITFYYDPTTGHSPPDKNKSLEIINRLIGQ